MRFSDVGDSATLHNTMRGLVTILGLVACAPSQSGLHLDGGLDASGVPADADVDAASPELRRVQYTTTRTHSPITRRIADHLRSIASITGLRDDVFAKIGGASLVSTNALHCLGGDRIQWSTRGELESTRQLFVGGDIEGVNAFQRTSSAAGVAWTTADILLGEPSPLAKEHQKAQPRYALVHVGLSEIGRRSVFDFGAELLALTDWLASRGTIPILLSPLPRAAAILDQYVAVVRGVAQGRQLPHVDLRRELETLPDSGLGTDGVHPTVMRDNAEPTPCVFDDTGLQFGYNVLNLQVVAALDRVVGVVTGQPEPDATGTPLDGQGSHEQPYRVMRLPYVDVQNTRDSPHRAISLYRGCDAQQDESGPEYVYELTLDEAARVRAMVVSATGADLDVHVLSGGNTGLDCVERNHLQIVRELPAGTHRIIIDTFVSAGTELSGEYILAILAEPT